MAGSRVRKSMKNTIFGLCGMIIYLAVSFFSKSIFISLLGNEYNGVNYLFTGILNALNLAELGFGGAIAYALYKPLSIQDHEQIAALMNFYKKVYRIIALVVLFLGSLCIPFLQYVIKEDINNLPFSLGQLRIYYIIFLLNTVFSYLLAYKRTIINADQCSYITTSVDYSANIILTIVQVVFLYLTKNYYVFLLTMLAKTIINNIIIQIIANKKYPYLLQLKNEKLLKKDTREILKNVKAMMFHKIGSVIIINTSTVVVSALVGLQETSLYGNYIMIATQVTSFINIFFTALTASIGNLCAEESVDKQIDLYNKLNYVSLWLGYFTFICYVCLYNPFMEIWLGQNMIFNNETVIMIAFYQSIQYLRKSTISFRDAKGLFVYDQYKPLVEAAVGISLALILGKYYGVFGIMLGYSISTLFIAIPIEIFVLIKKGFNGSFVKYLLQIFFILIITSIVTYVTYIIVNLLNNGIGYFILKLTICLIIPNSLFILCTFWTKEFKYYKNLIKSMLKKLKFKNKKYL